MLKFEENLASRVSGALQPMLGVQVTVTAANGLPATLYADDESTVLDNPLTTDANGYFGFKAANGEYTLTFAGAQIQASTRKIDLYDPDDDPPLTLAQAAAVSGAERIGGTWFGDKIANLAELGTALGSALIGHGSGSLADALAELDANIGTKGAPFVILATGQSNVQQSLAYNWEPPSNLKVWEWPGLGNVGTKFISAPSITINHTVRAAAEIARANPTRVIYVVRIASSGRTIDHWLPGGQDASGTTTWDAYNDCKRATEAALAVLGVSKIDLMHWHQGESDVTTGGTYIDRWNQVFARFTAESWFPTNTPIIINGITSGERKGNANYRFQNIRLKQIVAASPWSRMYVPTSEIVPSDMWLADGLHMTAAGHDLLGRMEGLCFLYGIGSQQAQAFSFDNETGAVVFGGELPTGLANFEFNRGDKLNGPTSSAVINTGEGASDSAASRVVGKNGVYSATATATGSFSTSIFHKWTGTGGQYFGVESTGSVRFFLGNTETLGVFSDFSVRWKGSVRINGSDGAFVPPAYTITEVLALGRNVKRLVMVTDGAGITRPAYADGTNWRWVSDDSIITA